MIGSSETLALKAFQRAAALVPAYRQILSEAGVVSENVTTHAEFLRLPILEKENTFRRFPIEALCLDGRLGQLASVLTSSGHSGVFAFGLTEPALQSAAIEWMDHLFDMVFSVRSRKTLLINCLPMGVKVSLSACTVAETSVRPDMAIALVEAFKNHFDQFIILGDPAFTKLLLEMGQEAGIDWLSLSVNLIMGEETLPENARIYFEDILGIHPDDPKSGIVTSSMGVGEIGLNIFFEVPSSAPLIRLRRLLHTNASLREALLGPVAFVPSLFTFDPQRIFVEFDSDDRLILTSLDPYARLPLIRYFTGDVGARLHFPDHLQKSFEDAGFSWDALHSVPIVMIRGRRKFAVAGEHRIYPEAVKEGIYANKNLVQKTTANFRIVSGEDSAVIRIQLSPGVTLDRLGESEFESAIAKYVSAPFKVSCESYSSFASGMSLDFERKFDYLGR